MTPEGRVKDAVKKRLAKRGVFPFVEVARGQHPTAVGTFYMPVAGPRMVHGVHDFVGCYRSIFWSIETKAPTEKVDETVPQGLFRTAIQQAAGFSMTGVRDAAQVDDLLDRIDRFLDMKREGERT